LFWQEVSELSQWVDGIDDEQGQNAKDTIL
jgi:hypothetical protein